MIPLVLTGTGLVCAVGHDVATACASLRCGMTRPRPLAFKVSTSLGAEPVTGHPLWGITEGFQGLGLYVRLTSLALGDLLDSTGLDGSDAGFWGRTALYVGLSRTRNEAVDFYDDILKAHLARTAIRLVGLHLAPERTYTVFHGNVSALAALREATTRLEEGAIERALIVCADSLVGDDELGLLMADGRLKTPERPRGLVPGEAVAALLVEPETVARRRGAFIQCRLGRVSVGQEAAPRASGGRPTGIALSEVLEQTLRQAGRVGAIYGDLNGEDTRAQEWANALVRLSARGALADAALHWPAASLGDTGAASGAIAVVAAARSFVKGYAEGARVLVWSSSDEGQVAAVLLKHPLGDESLEVR
ncbi:hypothetical protein [Corallococcus sicarius]|nr:hypothetical protein [Corallococcus sicarius]